METEPDEITVIVVSGKDLQGKKAGRHKFSVIFGVGSRKYRTCVVKDPNGCPEWNEESVMYVKYILKKDFRLEGFTGTFQLLFVVKGYIWVSINYVDLCKRAMGIN